MQFQRSISRGAGRLSGLARAGVWLVLILLLAGTALAQADGDDEMPAPKRTTRKKKAAQAEAATEAEAPQQDAPKREPAAKSSAKKTEPRKGGGAGPTTASEGTSSEHPDWPLTLWSDGPAVAWRSQAYGCAQQVEKLLAQLEKATGKTAAKKRVAAIGSAHVLLIEMERHVARLRMWTEPAAVDLGLRLKALRTRLNPIVDDVRSNNSQLMHDVQLALRERCQKAEKQLAAIKKLRDAGKSEVAETRLLKLYGELAPDGVWYPQHESSSPLYPFEVLRQGLTDDLAPERQHAAHDAMQQYRDEQKPDYAALLADVDAATANIAAGRPVKVGGKTLDGPQAVEAFLARWPELHFRMLHVGAMESALADFKVLPPESAATQSYRKFAQDLTAALVKLIDAEPAQGDQVATRHAAYLRALRRPCRWPPTTPGHRNSRPHSTAWRPNLRRSPPRSKAIAGRRAISCAARAASRSAARPGRTAGRGRHRFSGPAERARSGGTARPGRQIARRRHGGRRLDRRVGHRPGRKWPGRRPDVFCRRARRTT